MTDSVFYLCRSHSPVKLADDELVCLYKTHSLEYLYYEKQLIASLLSLFLCMATPAFAVDTGAVLGGAIGGGIGAGVGSEVGGREGAIIGGAVGGGVGAAIGTSDTRHKHEKTVIYLEQPRQDGLPTPC